MSRRVLWLCALAFGGAFTACVADHSALEKKPDVGGAGSEAGGASGASGGFAQIGGSGGVAANGGGHPDDEPPGTSVLTIVNGVVDAPRLALCFASVDADANVVPFGEPLGQAPLEYGQSLALREIPGADLAHDTLQPLVIAGELELIAGLDCAAAIAQARAEEQLAVALEGAAGSDDGVAGESSSLGGARGEGGAAGETGAAHGGTGGAAPVEVRARLRVRGLPAIPSGTLSAGRSLLLVANGCLGGATYHSSASVQYCGTGYSAGTPTVSAVLVSLSRLIAFQRVGMQLVNASLASAPVQLNARPPIPSTDAGISIASGVAAGQVAPRPATVLNSVFDYGSARNYRLELSSQGTAQFSFSWSAALALGGLTELADGATYAIVFSGPRGDLPAQPNLWNAPTLTVVAVEPEPVAQ